MFSRSQLILLAFLALVSAFVWYAVFSESDRRVAVHILDVGQGDAILVESPSGNQVLIDGGPGRRVLAELGKLLPAYDKSIDVVIATHTDYDHLAGLVEVAEHYDIGVAFENGFPAKTDIAKKWNAALESERVPRRRAAAEIGRASCRERV